MGGKILALRGCSKICRREGGYKLCGGLVGRWWREREGVDSVIKTDSTWHVTSEQGSSITMCYQDQYSSVVAIASSRGWCVGRRVSLDKNTERDSAFLTLTPWRGFRWMARDHSYIC